MYPKALCYLYQIDAFFTVLNIRNGLSRMTESKQFAQALLRECQRFRNALRCGQLPLSRGSKPDVIHPAAFLPGISPFVTHSFDPRKIQPKGTWLVPYKQTVLLNELPPYGIYLKEQSSNQLAERNQTDQPGHSQTSANLQRGFNDSSKELNQELPVQRNRD